MRRLAGALKWLGMALAILFVIAGVGAGWYTFAVLPAYTGEMRLAGLNAPVDVVRDKEGVPHIYAASESDAVFAQGAVHAQDRLWQMEMHRRIANGRMAEILGPNALPIDRMLRTLGIRRTAEAMYRNLDPASKAYFDAYARGVNAYFAQRSGPLPPEFYLTGAPAPEPWTPADSIGWTLMMAWDLGGNWRTELQRLQLAQRGLSVEQINALLPLSVNEKWPSLETAQTLLATLYKDMKAEAGAVERLFAAMPGYEEGMGSNNWVVSGAKSQTGKPLLANDPHLGLVAPALWYFAHLSSPESDVIGATLPGVPGVILGRNKRIAWGFTNTGPDVQDLFIEKINPANPDEYQTPDDWRKFDVVEERIRVKGQADVVLKVRQSRHGPVISGEANEEFGKAAPKGHAIAFAWAALSPENTTPASLAGIARARNWDEFLASARLFHAPQQNMVYADVDGNIGYVAPGRVPVRKPENDLNGLYPAPGWDARYDWDGFIAFEDLPREFNPARGFRQTANERIVDADYKPHLTYEWATDHRARRILDVLPKTEKHTLASFRDLQADVVSYAVREALPHLLKATPAGEKEKRAQDMLARFDATMSPDRAEPLIATAWMREVARLTYGDEVGADLMKSFFDQRHLFVMSVLSGQPGREAWCDDISSPPKETCPEIIARALTAAIADLEQRFGPDWSKWRWGEAHVARSEHRPLSNVAAVAKYFDVRVPTGGDTYTVNVGRHTIRKDAEPFVSTHAASLRALYDLSDLEKSVFIHSTGQSGILFSPQYASFSKRWADVQYIPMVTERKTAEKDALGTLKLKP